MKKSNRSFVLCIFLAVISLAVGILVLPVFGLTSSMLSAVLALVLGSCMIAFILPEIMSTRGLICVLNFFEFLLFAIVALLLVIQQVLPFLPEANCRFLAIALWIHAMVDIFKIYNTRIATMRHGIPFALLLDIIFITFATALFLNPFISDAVLSWACPVFFFVLTFLMAVLSLLYSPKRKA